MWRQLLAGVVLKSARNALVLALFLQNPFGEGVGLDSELGLGILAQVVIPIKQIFGKRAVVEDLLVCQIGRLSFFILALGCNQLLELPRKTRLTCAVEGVNQLHLLAGISQLFGDLEQRLAHVRSPLLPASESSITSRGNARIAFGAMQFRGASLR